MALDFRVASVRFDPATGGPQRQTATVVFFDDPYSATVDVLVIAEVA